MIKTPSKVMDIDGFQISNEHPTYFIADIAANHDGNLDRAKNLIKLAAEAGANAAKFQHFKADTIVNDAAFKQLGNGLSHQSKWKKSVFEVYEDASVSMDWTQELVKTCKEVGITFFTSPYSLSIIDDIDPYVPAYKIGSGDITWTEIIRHIASKEKPYIMATGASTFDDVMRAVEIALSINPNLCLMQCNTNYTASVENFKYIQLRVLNVYKEMFPDLILGLSDHTPGYATVLGAVTLGARVIEKHFTDDCGRVGPDHAFSMDPYGWAEMVRATRELEAALGNGIKRVEGNESETVILQRRSICVKNVLHAGQILGVDDVEFLRPCPKDALPPYMLESILNRKLKKQKNKSEYLRLDDFEE